MRYLFFVAFVLSYLSLKAQSCCDPSREYTNVNQLPDVTSVQQFINAGNYPSDPGNVHVLSNDNVLFIAGDEINLDPGFETFPGADFTAKIGPCSSAPLSVTPLVTLGPCSHTISAIVCNPAGIPFEISWSTGATDVLSIEVSPSSVTNYWLEVKNLNDNSIIHKNIEIHPAYFNQQPSTYFIYNSFEPDGDGWHDIWYPRADNNSSNDNVQSMAFDAYKFKLQIFNRWGSKVLHLEDERVNPGFSEDDIFWNGQLHNNSGMLPPAEYYYILELWSCTGYEDYSGSITSVNASSRTSSLTDATSEEVTGVTIFPNPAKDLLSIELPFGNNKVSIIDMLGNEVISERHSGGTVALPVDHLHGVYIVKVKSQDGKETISKVIIE